MRIALIGNLNNNFFPIALHLKKAGYDVTLFYRYSVEHFQPKADTFFLKDLEVCKEVFWSSRLTEENRKQITKNLVGFDFYIGQGDEAALAAFAGINFDVYYPYGSDFYKYAWQPEKYSILQIVYNKLISKMPIEESLAGTLAGQIKKAIVNAKNVLLDSTNSEYENKLINLNLKGQHQNFPMPFVYPDTYLDNNRLDTHWKTEIDKLRTANDFLVLYHGRQEWKKALTYKNNDFTNKNTQNLIYGFASFVKKNQGLSASLVLLDYGNDVNNSKDLIDELGISSHIVWLPKMYRKDLMYLISLVDVCSGEFNRSFLTFGTVIEAMLMGKPVINYREDSLYKAQYPELYPCYVAREPLEIEAAIQRAWENPKERIAMGQAAREWVLRYFVEKPVKKLVEIIENKRTILNK